ncbi:flagellar hook-associated protein FlgK [Rhizobium rhizosphaerae]|uniref:Flagellar hook-associated protein 1 n=1 Tax=Xaviernesmea rhizosphaerae TaxID=1672749 RepID=A0A1Q9AIP8_9HYPH|nr:flagellar hook-associated protein FlgK [Xaviernesmea rhizosphaerae]OLP55094.1 flagellar hook-associated protein FlgK [Xaviernesmea rhizosphaerae]OQP84356.1 flagellar hook-associated protein FlgK [Xaviernesmea rhizosphaerae]
MSLSSAISTAQQIFSNTAQQTSVLSKNIANANNSDYARRMATLSTSAHGAEVVTIQRAQNDALLKQKIISNAQSTGQDTLMTGLDEIRIALGGNDYTSAPSSYLSKFRDSLQTLASTPSSRTTAASTVAAAGDLAKSLNTAADKLQDMRRVADADIADSVAKLNSLLSDFEIANHSVQGALSAGADAGDALDQRDKLLSQMSEIIGISTVTRKDNDMVIYTSDGTVLFENKPRQVTFQQTNGFDAGTTGAAIYVDGIAVKGGQGANTTAQGKLPALLQLRDDVLPTFQTQLDEVARGLVEVFKEGSGQGLFKANSVVFGSVSNSSVATAIKGYANTISVNPAAVANPLLVRDGGFNGVVSNTTGSSGYTTLIDSFVTALGAKMAFDPAAGLTANTSLLSFSTESVGWLEQMRSTASSANDNKSALLTRTQESLSNLTGVNMNEELSLMLDLEQSYKASAKLLTTVDAMMTSLLDAVR